MVANCRSLSMGTQFWPLIPLSTSSCFVKLSVTDRDLRHGQDRLWCFTHSFLAVALWGQFRPTRNQITIAVTTIVTVVSISTHRYPFPSPIGRRPPLLLSEFVGFWAKFRPIVVVVTVAVTDHPDSFAFIRSIDPDHRPALGHYESLELARASTTADKPPSWLDSCQFWLLLRLPSLQSSSPPWAPPFLTLAFDCCATMLDLSLATSLVLRHGRADFWTPSRTSSWFTHLSDQGI